MFWVSFAPAGSKALIAFAAGAPVPRYCPKISTVAEPDPVETEQMAASGAGAAAQRAVNAPTISAARDHG